MSYDYLPSPRSKDGTFLFDAPIFARLARLWLDAGRTVPGRPDQEWQHLVEPPRFRPLAEPAPPPPPVRPDDPAPPTAPADRWPF
ncbi:hypothetical protein [Streptomyces sp. BE303]|uniref:hypothetical protein n=1 Tax=Streptomyces sp. BE303 TaxID=3002528 RepID=UPI002E793E5B|nr:hypothetical protein [Streptomyces sp. BE303]MED7955004.1 hypothetical protein [Streptomyces sp. BE303]